jgi:hypothetical protein
MDTKERLLPMDADERLNQFDAELAELVALCGVRVKRSSPNIVMRGMRN